MQQSQAHNTFQMMMNGGQMLPPQQNKMQKLIKNNKK